MIFILLKIDNRSVLQYLNLTLKETLEFKRQQEKSII